MDTFFQALLKEYIQKLKNEGMEDKAAQQKVANGSATSQPTVSRLADGLQHNAGEKIINYILTQTQHGQTPESLAKLLIK